jgi:hypothetical protein
MDGLYIQANTTLLGAVNPSQKYECQLGYHSQYMEKEKSCHVPNHQPVHMFPQQTGDVSWFNL